MWETSARTHTCEVTCVCTNTVPKATLPYICIISQLWGQMYRNRYRLYHNPPCTASRGSVHRVGRVLNFFSSRRNWDSPNPSPGGECAHPRFWGEGHTRWRERGWESPNSDEGAYTVVFFLYSYFVIVHTIRDLPNFYHIHFNLYFLYFILQRRHFSIYKEPRNRFQGVDSASLLVTSPYKLL